MTSSLADAEDRDVITTSRDSLGRRRRGVGEAQRLVAERVPGVVGKGGERLAGGERPPDQTRQVHRDVDQPAAVVAEVEDELGDAGLAQRVEGFVQRGHRRPDEVAEEQIADASSVDIVGARERHGGNRHRPLRHSLATLHAGQRAKQNLRREADLTGAERGADLAGRHEAGDRAAIDFEDRVTPGQPRLRRGAVGIHLQDAQMSPSRLVEKP